MTQPRGQAVHPPSDSKRWSPSPDPSMPPVLTTCFLALSLSGLLPCPLLSADTCLSPWPSPNCACRKRALTSVIPTLFLDSLGHVCLHCVNPSWGHELVWLVSASYFSIYKASTVFLNIQMLFPDPNSRICRF